ncbi:MAG: DUF4199 domain-containing protein [Alphaproteobacteria bacterium]|nr:DUF4199 domain-containing protein [Reyranella sp.]MBL6940456.1 DUF4199 domain-containing protein [Alphaproteobacteria bacterium]MBL7100306.1 DUF4199 domain-containing protein [Alphaproteobacteria bacterium]
MLRRILIYGLIAGILVGIPTFAVPMTFRHISGSVGMVIGYTSMLIAFSMIFLAIKHQRDEVQGGVIRFLPALGVGLGITVIASVIYVLAWEAYMSMAHYDFGADYARMIVAQAKASGASGPALARAIAQAAEFQRQYADPLFRFPMTFIEIFPVGVLVSLICAGLLCNSRFLPARRALPA